MAHSMDRYLKNPAQAEDVGQKCRSWVLKNATWKIRAQEILQLVEEVR